MISLFQKSLDVKLAASLFIILCVVFTALFFSFSRTQSYQAGQIADQISNTLSRIETGKLSPNDHKQISEAKALLQSAAQTLSDKTYIKFILITGSCLIAIMLCMGAVFQLIFLKPLKALTLNLENTIKGEERDLTLRINSTRQDQIGTLADCFDAVLANLDHVIANIGRKTETIAAASSEVFMMSEQMDRESTDLSQRSNSVAAAAEEMNTSMHTVAAASEEASTNISVVAGTAGQMQTNITGVAQNCKDARKISNNALTQVDTATKKVALLGDAAKKISKVTQVITEIAEQTDLLALNATIEAARAGESGKGFAVVASEIKNLASQTADATRNIRETVESIQNSTRETVDEVGNISKVIAQVDDIVNQIAAAINEQSDSATEVATNIEQASIGISEVNENVAQSSQVASEIAKDIASVDSIASEMSDRVSSMAKGAKDLDRLSISLKEMISIFRISLNENHIETSSTLTEKDIPDLMPWSSTFELSIPQIDTHHKELVRLVNSLHKAMRMQKGAGEVKNILANLAEYTVFHFGFEEELFQKYRYPELNAHKKMHQDLVARVVSFQEDLKNGKTTVTLDLMTFLKDWLKNHIFKTDKAYVPFLKEKM